MNEPEVPIRVGDVARLRSGSPPLTVTAIQLGVVPQTAAEWFRDMEQAMRGEEPGGPELTGKVFVSVSWFEGRRLREARFPISAFQL